MQGLQSLINNLVIHIGDPKNGSTSIQKTLAEALWQSGNRSVVLSPNRNEVALGKAMRKNAGPNEKAKRFPELADWARSADADYGVVSSEFLTRAKPREFKEALDQYLPEFSENCRIVAYVRPHADRFVSTYAQRVKMGLFVQDMAPLFDTMGADRFLTYHKRFTRWRSVFGERFVLRPFVREGLRDQDVVSDFLHIVLEGEPFTLQQADNANQSLGVRQIAGMRVFQNTLITEGVPKVLRTIIGGAVGYSVGHVPGAKDEKLALDRSLMEQVDRRFRADARQTDDTFFDSPWLENALDRSLEKARPEPQSTQPLDHLTSGKIKEIEQIAKDCVTRAEGTPKIWRAVNSVLRGYVDPQEAENLNANQRHARDRAVVLCEQAARLIA